MKINRHGNYFVYMLQCRNGTYYTGYTSNLEKRIKEHNDGKRGAKYLRGKLPVKLAYAKEFRYYKRAVRKEAAIKKLSHKQKGELVRIYERKTFG